MRMRKTMKQVICFVLAFLMLASVLTGCGTSETKMKTSRVRVRIISQSLNGIFKHAENIRKNNGA